YTLEPIIHFLGGIIPPRNVFVNFDDFDPEDHIIINERVKERIVQFAKDMLTLMERLENDY
ncbi:MAG: NADH-dependent FMN reductase, partial [Caldibacillus sp.]